MLSPTHSKLREHADMMITPDYLICVGPCAVQQINPLFLNAGNNI